MGVVNSAKNCKQCKCELFINPGWGNGNNNKVISIRVLNQFGTTMAHLENRQGWWWIDWYRRCKGSSKEKKSINLLTNDRWTMLLAIWEKNA